MRKLRECSSNLLLDSQACSQNSQKGGVSSCGTNCCENFLLIIHEECGQYIAQQAAHSHIIFTLSTSCICHTHTPLNITITLR